MNRTLLLVLCSLSTASLAQLSDREYLHQSPTPAYLPRSVFLGSFLGDAVTPQVRVQWELTLIQERVDSFVVVLEGGGGYSISFPKNAGPNMDSAMTFFYQYTAQAGLGYRGTRPGGFHWGIQVATGPVFYGAHFNGLASEKGSIGVVEGRGQIGWKFGDVAYGFAVGVAQIYQTPPRLNAPPYLGGLMLGLFADWR